MKTLIEVLKLAAGYLEEHGVDSARLAAERMLSYVLGVGRLDLYLQYDCPLKGHELERFRELTRRRATGEPLQYILGEAAFRDLLLKVGPGVLIPRPETEQLVSLVLKRMDSLQPASGDCLRVLDMCTGSGAVGLSLAAERAGLWCVMSELTAPACGWAKRNLDRYRKNLKSPAVLLRCDLLSAFKPDRSFDLIVANPPYVRLGDIPRLRKHVREHEPAEALGAGPEGLDLIARIIAEAGQHLRGGGLLAMEVGETMREGIQRLFVSAGAYTEPEFHPDLAGKTRFVTAYTK